MSVSGYLLFEKKLSSHDLERLYVSESQVRRIYPAALNPAGTNPMNLLFHDASMNRWTFRLIDPGDGTPFLAGSWREFVRANRLREGDSIKFYELPCNGGGGIRLFQLVV